MKYFAILGKLIARTAVHIGTHESGDASDAPFRRAANGQYLLPGTAIAGVLRSIATRVAPRLGSPSCRLLWGEERRKTLAKSEKDKKEPCACWACNLFGDMNPNEDGVEVNTAEASRLIVTHALSNGSITKIRDGVGIERNSNAAASVAGAKFDFEVLPKGTIFDFRLELENRDGESENLELLLAATLAEWQAGRAWIGGRTGRGLGAFDLTEAKAVALDLANADDLLRYLENDKPWEIAREQKGWLVSYLQKARDSICSSGDNDGTALKNMARSYVNLRFGLKIDGGFLTNDTTTAAWAGFNHAPLLEMMTTDAKAILPGASLRGVLRSQAEKIARTLTTLDIDEENVKNPAEAFGAKCPACDPAQRQKVDDEKMTLALESCDHLIQRNFAPKERDNEEYLCLSCRLFGSTVRGSRLIIEDTEAVGSTPRKVLDFLAIDRFTGGGKEGAKFDALALWQPTFDVRIHFENPEDWELGWLALVLRDLAEGFLTVGFGAAKGFGRAHVDAFQVAYGFITDDDFCGKIDLARANTRPTNGLYRELTWDTGQQNQREELCQLAEGWVKEFNDTCKNFERTKDELKLSKDSYFNKVLPELYPKEAYTEWMHQS